MLMEMFFMIAAIIVLITIAMGFARVLLGPHKVDRMIAAQLFSTAGVAWMLLISFAADRPVLGDIALALALLAAVAAITFVKRAWQVKKEDAGDCV